MSSTLPRRIAVALTVAPLLLPACGGGGGGGGGSSAGGLVLLEVRWGKLADVRDSNEVLIARNRVVEEAIQSDFLTYEVTTNPVTEVTTIKILSPQGTPGFDAALAGLDDQLGFVLPKSIASPPPYSMVPRNAVMVLKFNQAVKQNTLTAQTVRVFQGVPAQNQLEVLLRLDPSDPRNVIVDPTVNSIDSEVTGLPVNAFGFPPATTTTIANLQLRIPTVKDPANGQSIVLRGDSGSFPEDDNAADGTDMIRTFRSGGTTVATGDPNNGFVLDLVPPAIIGVQGVDLCGIEAVTPTRQRVSFGFNQPNCVFTPETGDVLKQGSALGLVVNVESLFASCGAPAVPARIVTVELLTEDEGGDPIELTTGGAEFNLPFEPGDEPLVGCFVTIVPEPQVAGGLQPLGVDPLAVARVRFSEPMDPTTVRPFDTLTITTANPGAGGAASLAPNAFVVGDLAGTGDLREFTFVPVLPIPHQGGTAESRFLRVETGASGVRDLSGNAVSVSGFNLEFRLLASAPQANTGGFALRFNSINETNHDFGPPDLGVGPDPVGAGKPDVGGQVSFDPVAKELRGRPVARFTKVADYANPFVGGAPVQLPAPILTPITSFGSRLQTLWRHDDLGLSGSERNEMNLDVERLSWAPFTGNPTVAADTMPRFRVDLSHCYFFPDEVIDPASLLPSYPQSGVECIRFYPTTAPTVGDPDGMIGNPFWFWYWNPEANNGSGGVVNNPPLTVVDQQPWDINPLDTFITPTLTVMQPYPLFSTTYTWRDTNIPFARKGGPNNAGVEPAKWSQVLPGNPPPLYPTGQVPSVCLPLLMQFRSYPPTGGPHALNVNGLQVSLMVNTSAQPNFRVFSTGGYNTANNLVTKNPDLNTPSGGFNANPNNGPIGAVTAACGPELYWGQADFVVRVSRAFTHWFDLGAPASTGAPLFAAPVLEPKGEDQPLGTSVIVDFRGASTVSGTCAANPPTCDALTTAAVGGTSTANVYGVYITNTGTATTPPNQAPTTTISGIVPPFSTAPAQASVLPEWTPTITRLNGKRYLQARFTFLSNVQTGDVSRLSSLGVAFVK